MLLSGCGCQSVLAGRQSEPHNNLYGKTPEDMDALPAMGTNYHTLE